MDDKRCHYSTKMVLAVSGISMGAVSYAYAGSIVGTTLGQPSFITYMGLATNPNAEGLIGTIVGLFYAGGVFGAILSTYLADSIGRKWTAAIGSVILVVSTACLAGSVNIAMFIVFRFFVGMGAYMLYLTTPLWVTELVPPRGRSILVGIVGLGGVVGYVLAAYVGVGFFYYGSEKSAQWRAPLSIGCLPPLLLIAFLPWLPESPRFLLKGDKTEKAWLIVRDLHATSADTEHEYAQAEFFQMRKQHELDTSLDGSWMAILKRRSYLKRAAIAFFLPVMLYSTGNLVVTTYAASVFAELGYDAGASLQLLAGLYVAAIVANLLSLTYVDRVPRNIMLGSGVVVVTIIISIETALQATYLGTGNKTGLAATAAFLFLFLACFNMFLEAISWYYASEIFPTHLRAKGMTLGVVGFCLIDILWLELAPTAFASIAWKYYLVFICVSVVSAAVIFFTFPNTLHMPLEEVAKLFGDDDLVAVYQRDIHIDHEKHQVVEQAAETEDVRFGGEFSKTHEA
jgi:MFS family permease